MFLLNEGVYIGVGILISGVCLHRTESELVEVIVNEVKEHLESMRQTSRDHGLSSSQNSSPDEPNSGGLSHNNRDDDDPMPQDSSSTRKCLSNG